MFQLLVESVISAVQGLLLGVRFADSMLKVNLAKKKQHNRRHQEELKAQNLVPSQFYLELLSRSVRSFAARRGGFHGAIWSI